MLLLLGGVTLFLGACADVPYYWQAGMGQLEIIAKRRPISEVLEDPVIEEEVKRKLRLVRSAQDFGTKRLAMPAEGQYRFYTDLGRPYVSWLVVAAKPLALEEHRFCYFIVGCLGYRGFFDKDDARALALELKEQGLDVFVRPVTAYSTLGWFDDPVLNTFLPGADTSLIGTVFHEQTHRRYFLEGDTTFNESFAGFVEEAGVRLFLASGKQSGPEKMRRYQTRREDRRRYLEIVLRGRERLKALYASNLPKAEMRMKKQRLIDKMRQDYHNRRNSFKILDYDDWFAQPLNNAHLVGIAHYTRHVAAFRALFEEQGRDFSRFYQAVETLGGLPPEQRETRLNMLEKKIVARPS